MNTKTSNPNKRTIILTGATGVVGTHILYELLLQIIEGYFEGKIILLVRADSKRGISGYDRIRRILSKDFIPDYLKIFNTSELMINIKVLECKFGEDDLSNMFSQFRMEGTVFLIHSAASTNLAPSNSAEIENHEVNYKGSLKLFESCKTLVNKVIYISTVYACGKLSGLIKNEYSEIESPSFKNPYEQYKFKTERALAAKCKEWNIEYQILRPGVVVGRLIDPPHYFLPKYNVVYAFAAFFHNLKERGVNQCIYIRVNPKTSLHLVSVDYVAKTITKAYTESSVKELNIIPRKGCNKSKIELLLTTVGYTNYKFVDKHSTPKNPYQRAYQTKVAPSFEPYINDEAIEFDNEQLKTLMSEVDMPIVDDNFESLISFAVSRNFEIIN